MKTKKLNELEQIIEKLRSNDGCPWDKELTFESLSELTLEETYELIDAVKALAEGKTYFSQYAASVLATQYNKPAESWQDPYKNLTNREREVFHLIIEGKTTKEIARSLDISVKTAENHRGKVLDKLDVANAAELVRYAAKHHLLM